MNPLKEFIQKYTSIPNNEWEQIKSVFEQSEFQKNELILGEGKICRYFWFLEKGVIRFYINNDGEESPKIVF